MIDYEFASPPPWDHQRKGFFETCNAEFFGILWEQRCGKSRVIIDTAAYNYELGRIDGVLLLAPNGVHRNWITEGFAQFLPERIPSQQLIWRSGKMHTKANVQALADLLPFDGLSVLAMNYDALSTKAAKQYLGKFLRKRKLLIVGDESDDLSTPSAARTMTAIRAAKYGVMRRILTGTPAAETPFSLYSQTNFLKMFVLGFTSFLAFKAHHAVLEEGMDREHRGKLNQGYAVAEAQGILGDDADVFAKNFARGAGKAWTQVATDKAGAPRYQNLDELQEKLSKFTSRLTRAECGGQLPQYATRPFELAPAQRKAYDELREEFLAELGSGQVSAAMVLVRYARLQQIASGYCPLDRNARECPTCGGVDPECCTCEGLGLILDPQEIAYLPNPRLDVLEAELRGTRGQTVIWTRFTYDVEAITAKLLEMGRHPGRYDGKVSDKQRDADKEAFQRGELTDIVASPQAGGRGLDFSMARTAFFYSHHWSLRLRLQSQDRIETLKKKDPAVIVDLTACDTVDEKIVACHRDKRSMQDAITGDDVRRWL